MSWQTFRLRALWCWHQLLTLALALVVMVAVMVGVSRQLLPMADHYRPQVEAALSQRLGLPVKLERLEGAADGVQLRLRLVQMELRDPATPAKVLLSIPEVELRPALWQMLRHGELRFDVRMRGLNIHLDQLPGGRLQLRELAGLARRGGGTAARTLSFALRQPALALSESRIGLALQNFPEISLGSVDIVNRNDGNRHRLRGRVQLPGVSEELAVQLDLDGNPLHWEQSRLRAWLRLPVMDWEPWLPALPSSGPGLRRLRGGGSYWLDFNSGRLVRLQARVDWREVLLEGPQGRHRLRDMQGELAWQRSPQGWQLAGQGLQGVVDDLAWPLPQLALRKAGDKLTVALARSNLGNAAKLLGTLALPEALAGWLREAAPSGELVGLRADLTAAPAGAWQLRRLDAEGRWLGARAVGRFPGGHNLAGWLRWTPDQAWLGLDSRVAQLFLPDILREPVAVRDLRGRLRLMREGRGWRLDSDRLQLVNPDLKAAGVLSVSLPGAGGGAPRLSLLGGVADARLASAWRYIPWHSASDARLAWLRQGLKAGTVRRGEFAFEGPLPASETDPARLLLKLELERGRVDYAPGWPELRDLQAAVTLDGRRLAIAASDVRMLEGSRGEAISAAIPDLRAPVLQLSATLASNGPDLMRLFRESPLKARVPGLTDVLALEGPVAGRLELALPLQGGGAPEVSIVAQLRDNLLLLPQARLAASDLRGEIRYSTAGGLQAERIEAQLLEAPVRAAIQTRRNEMVVSLAGTAGVPALRRWLGSSLLEVASGSTPYQARVILPAGASPRLQLDASLAGLRLNLPAPLGKAAKDAVPLRYQTSLGGREQRARLQYGQRLSGGLLWEGNRLDRALLRLDSRTPDWPRQPGLEIEGRLPRLDLGEWKPWLAHFRRPAAAATVAARGETPLPALTRLDLETRELVAEGWRLRNARVGLVRDPAAWRLFLDSDELNGRAQLPDDARKEIVVEFARLQWPLPTVAAAPAAAAGLNPVAGLGNRPLAVRGEGLRLAAWPNLGALAVSARLLPMPYGLRVESIGLRSPMLDFDGRLDWQWRGGVNTRLRGKAGSANIAGLLAALGYAPSLVSRRAGADLDLTWRGAPDSPVLSALDGQLGITLEAGRLLNVSTGASVSRVFGWFDLDNLRRRFKGDFSDVLRRGLSFDRLSLAGPLQAGIMEPAVFQVAGATLNATGQGRLDLPQQRMDQHLTVTIPVSSAVPLAAVVVAGPVVGGAVAAAQKAFRKQLNQATQLHYRISGDWNDPAVQRLSTAAKPAPVDAVAREAE